jgi:hypothetical protein
MYGTVARIRVKPGMSEQLKTLSAEYQALQVPGHVATFVYQLDADPNDHYLVAVFQDRETYVRNAQDPAQDARYQRLRAILEADPKWHDGEVVWSDVRG